MKRKELINLKQFIAEEPRRFTMSTWLAKIGDGIEAYSLLEQPPCDTAACLGGSLILMHGLPWHESGESFGNRAAAIAKLTLREKERLFYLSGWPIRYRNQYRLATTPSNRIKVAQRRIQYFLDTNGTDKRARKVARKVARKK